MAPDFVSARIALKDMIEDIAVGVGPTPDDADERIDAFADAVRAAALNDFANRLTSIADEEGYNADPARRSAFAEIIDMVRVYGAS